jgi:hypothetical protein
VIVDGDMKILPAGAMGTTTTAVRADLDVGEAAQLLNVEVQQIAGSLVLVADDGRGRFEISRQRFRPRRRRMRLMVARLRPMIWAMW